ncbi:DUF3000 domain-containing protein [Leucobacter sp. M11]|uniref:DUF3000 domain-containing protein n=1 Tax=Leucobacter sp. M11 TaxID=2993565 RepID=UPI002D7FBC60|nr:DUF3000 domain-containing protein [Leucobacter sp. M11]MEB4616187.1 DUF3000 domain-containing protein [Leucobacter sp. M11]
MVTNGEFPPAAFSNAAEQIRALSFRDEVRVREIASPERTAPRSLALAADVFGPEDESPAEHGSGRFILLNDPASEADWGSPFRVVCFAQAPLELEIGSDPLLADVAWSWLLDALEARGAEVAGASGTASQVLSTGFGSLREQGDGAQIEIRASWTPLGDRFDAHAAAWADLLCQLAGIPANGERVASLTQRRVRRG